MKKLFLPLIILTSLIYSKSFSQTYGNEWIQPSQKYLKIKISEDGVYKISYSDLVNKSFKTGDLDPIKFQIFNKGIEVPLYITGANDGLFNDGDLIYFYGAKNDASLDKALYSSPDYLPNSEVSLFGNDNYYFITYSTTSKNGLRYQVNSQVNTSLISEPFLITKERINLASNYYPGEYILEGMSLSEYVEGEGYLGALFGKGAAQSYSLNSSNFLSTSLYQPTLSFYVAGRSNAYATNNQGKNHHLKITNNSTTLFDSLYRGYATIRKTVPININNSSIPVNISSVDDLGAVTDFQAVGYVEISYARNFNLNEIKQINFSLPNSKTNNLLTFTNSSLSLPFIIEKNGLNIYFNSTSSTNIQFSLSSINPSMSYYLGDLTLAKSVHLNEVVFENINSSKSKNYLIISNKILKEGALMYKEYNESIGMPTALVFTDDLYNEFYYGFHHPLALRNYCKFMIEKGDITPEYLLLLGKGYENSREYISDDLVPTIGYPGSDNMLTSGLNNSNLEPGLATGRVPARNNTDIINYLNKLKVYNKLGNDLWRKKILQATGGKTIGEVNSFANYQENLYQISKQEYFGATRSRVYKNVTDPITENQTERIIKETKDGIALLSYLGHGSATGTEIAFGKAIEQQNNTKPTIYLVNGCSTGQCFTSINALSEDFILVKDVGAIGWIGTTSEGVASYLMNASAKYHDNWFKKLYSQPIAKGFKEGLKSFQNGNDKLNLAHTRQYIYLGDPAIKFSSSQKADFRTQNAYLFPTEPSQNATSTNLKVSLIVENTQKSINDSVAVSIERTLPDNSIVKISNLKIKPIYNLDTIRFELSNIGLNVAGNNKIKITVNSDNKISESNLLDNTATLDLFLPGNGVKTIYPIYKGIVSKSSVALKAESEDMFTKNAEYLFEIDTVNTFNSPKLIKSPIISAGVFPQWTPQLILEDGKVYFWRVKLNLPVAQGGNWTSSSFTYLNNLSDGYSISNKSQLENLTLNNLSFSATTGNIEFKKSFFTTSITTTGDDSPEISTKRFRTNQSIDFGTPLFEGITIVAMSPLNPNKFFSYPSQFNSTNGPLLVNGYTGQFKWNTNDPIQVDSLVSFINQIPKDYHVIGFNGINTTINQLPEKAKIALQSFGLSNFNLINFGEPYMFWGVKGGNIGTALEFTADYSSAVSPKSQTIQKFIDLQYPLSEGSFITDAIGPSREWSSVDISFNKNNADNISYDIIGVTSDGSERTLINNVKEDNFTINTISGKNYPFIKVKTNVKDLTEFSFPSLNHITVESKPFSDISFDTDTFNEFKSKKIQEGDIMKWELGIRNTLSYTTDSISGTYTIIDQNKNSITKAFVNLAPLEPGETTRIKISESTLGLNGNNSIKIQLNSRNKDYYSFNNNIAYDFVVQKDDKQPILNVLFDGRNIINNEIISPRPKIQITNTDENKFLLMNDTSNVEVQIKLPQEDNFKRVNYSDKLLIFTPPTSTENNTSILEYNPEFLKDGTYTLKVKSKDVSGNAYANDYLVNFEVINKSSLTNFYPYPNPVVDAMKFVFTLTGSKVPDKIKITIYNSGAKVVRTITKLELGNIKIGNNISDFTWDCTDEFGDRLANGVYFYKVDIYDNDEDFTLRQGSSNDYKYFKENIGKIYIIR